MMQLTPAPNRLLVKPIEEKQESAQGIVMARPQGYRPPQGVVTAMGDAARDHLSGLQPGDQVYFQPDMAFEINHEGARFALVDCNHILAWVSA